MALVISFGRFHRVVVLVSSFFFKDFFFAILTGFFLRGCYLWRCLTKKKRKRQTDTHTHKKKRRSAAGCFSCDTISVLLGFFFFFLGRVALQRSDEEGNNGDAVNGDVDSSPLEKRRAGTKTERERERERNGDNGVALHQCSVTISLTRARGAVAISMPHFPMLIFGIRWKGKRKEEREIERERERERERTFPRVCVVTEFSNLPKTCESL